MRGIVRFLRQVRSAARIHGISFLRLHTYSQDYTNNILTITGHFLATRQIVGHSVGHSGTPLVCSSQLRTLSCLGRRVAVHPLRPGPGLQCRKGVRRILGGVRRIHGLVYCLPNVSYKTYNSPGYRTLTRSVIHRRTRFDSYIFVRHGVRGRKGLSGRRTFHLVRGA